MNNDKVINEIASELTNTLLGINDFLCDILELQKHRIVKRKIRFKKKFKYRYMMTYNPVADMIPVKSIFTMEKMLLNREKVRI